MSRDLEKISEKIKDHKKYLRDTYGINGIGVFGSFARNEDTLLSDVDLLFEIDESKDRISLFDLADIKVFLENILGRTVDVMDKKNIKPSLKDSILKETIMI